MTLKLHYHPLSAFCQKVLIALYENDTPFETVFVDFANSESREAFLKLWPVGQFPALDDTARDHFVPESSIIIEYLAQHYPGKVTLIPDDPDLARQTRFRDRFFDLHVAVPMQKIVTDRIRPAGKHDPYGVEQAKARLHTALALIDEGVQAKTWAMGESFTMADCAAAPALAYANMAMPFTDTYTNAGKYLQRLMARPSFARAWAEAEPYRANFPKA